MRTDHDGRFALPFTLRKEHPGPFHLEVRAAWHDDLLGGIVPLRELQADRPIEVGDIRLKGLQKIAFGRVVDDRGEPVGGARVGLQRYRDLGGTPPRMRWRDEAYVDARTDDDGTFSIVGDPLPGQLRLRARSRGHFAAATNGLVPGARVELVLARSGSLTGTARIPGWLPPRGLEVKLVSVGEPQRAHRSRIDRKHGDARYRFWNLRPGAYDLTVGISAFPDPLLQVNGLRIGPGPNELDPRLLGLDFSDSVYRFRLRAVGRDGLPVRDPGSPLVARVERQDGSTEFVGFPWRKGRVEIFSASPRLDVVQLGIGYRPQETTVAHGDGVLVFEALEPVELTLTGIRALCGAERRVRVSTVLTSDTGLPSSIRTRDQRSGKSLRFSRAQLSKSGGAWLDDGDTVRVRLMRDGQYQVVLRLYEPGVRGPVSIVMATVDVRLDPLTSQRIDVPVDPQKIRDALAELAGR